MSLMRVKCVLALSGRNSLILPLAFPSQQPTRNYAFKSDLKIKWVRPEKISCIDPRKSGDLLPIATVDLKQYPIEFQKSVELQDADQLVQKVFSLEFTCRKRAMEIARLDLINSVKRHLSDKGSMESRIASMTGDIRNLQQYLEEFPRDKVTKRRAKELIDKRKKFLKYLRRWDYKRFEWLLERLNLVYKSPPSEFKWVTRKDSLRKLTDLHCNTLIANRKAAYRASLDSQKLDFLTKKADTLRWIQDEERECGAEVTVSQDEIDAVLGQIDRLRVEQETSDVVK